MLVLFIDLDRSRRPRFAYEPLPRDAPRGVGDHAQPGHGSLPGDGFRLRVPWIHLGKRWLHARGVLPLLIDVRLYSVSYYRFDLDLTHRVWN